MSRHHNNLDSNILETFISSPQNAVTGLGMSKTL